MKRWEYKNDEIYSTGQYGVPDEKWGEELTMELNNLGVDGWEMISSTHNEYQYLMIFKRELRN